MTIKKYAGKNNWIKMFHLLLLGSIIGVNTSCTQPEEAVSIQFSKKWIASESFESVGVFDVNGDENPDIISGSFWYEGPDFINRYFIGNIKRYGEYQDDFSTIPMDVNGDGRMDYVMGCGWRRVHGNCSQQSGALPEVL